MSKKWATQEYIKAASLPTKDSHIIKILKNRAKLINSKKLKNSISKRLHQP
jgi:hypothetical protein